MNELRCRKQWTFWRSCPWGHILKSNPRGVAHGAILKSNPGTDPALTGGVAHWAILKSKAFIWKDPPAVLDRSCASQRTCSGGAFSTIRPVFPVPSRTTTTAHGKRAPITSSPAHPVTNSPMHGYSFPMCSRWSGNRDLRSAQDAQWTQGSIDVPRQHLQ